MSTDSIATYFYIGIFQQIKTDYITLPYIIRSFPSSHYHITFFILLHTQIKPSYNSTQPVGSCPATNRALVHSFSPHLISVFDIIDNHISLQTH